MGDFDFHALVVLAAVPSTTLLGCVAAYVYSDQKGINSSTKFLSGLFPDRSHTFYLRCDFIMSAIVGTCIAIILYSPTTAYQALAAGVGWTAAFNVLKSEKAHKAQPEPRAPERQGSEPQSSEAGGQALDGKEA